MEYYYIRDLKKVGKMDLFVPHLYDKQKGWVVDNDNVLMDRIMGYDPLEGIGNTDMLERAKTITEEEAIRLINKK